MRTEETTYCNTANRLRPLNSAWRGAARQKRAHLIRIWMRARVSMARAWEAAHALPSVFGGTDMGAQKAAWQASFVAEAAALARKEHAQGLLDLVKAFETVPHAVLVAAARALGYCLVLLRLSLAAYRLARTVSVDGAHSRKIRATRGITAGSGFATSELRVLLHPLMDFLHSAWADILVVKLYVDDLTLSVFGTPQWVIRALAKVIDVVVDWLERRLGMLVSEDKSKVLATKDSIAVAIVEATATNRVTATTRAKMLGVDSVGGHRRATATFQQRLANFSNTVSRFHAIRKLGGDAKQMLRTAGFLALTYDCDIFGLSDSALQIARARIATAASP